MPYTTWTLVISIKHAPHRPVSVYWRFQCRFLQVWLKTWLHIVARNCCLPFPWHTHTHTHTHTHKNCFTKKYTNISVVTRVEIHTRSLWLLSWYGDLLLGRRFADLIPLGHWYQGTRSLVYNGYCLIPGKKWPGHVFDHPPHLAARLKKE